jgi:hypothetical protein
LLIKAVAGRVTGWNIEHGFSAIYANSNIPAVPTPTEMTDSGEHFTPMSTSNFQLSGYPELEHYTQSGNVGELDQPTIASNELDSVTEPNKWSSTDIGNPMALDISLQAAGYDSNMLNPNRKLLKI